MKFDLDHIILYLENKLSQEQSLVFEAEMRKNPEFQMEVDLARLSQELIISKETIKIKSSIQEAKNSYFRTQKIKVFSISALALASVVGLSYLGFKNEERNTTSKTEVVSSEAPLNSVDKELTITPIDSGITQKVVDVENNIKKKEIFSQEFVVKETIQKTSSENEEIKSANKFETNLLPSENPSKETKTEKQEVAKSVSSDFSPCASTKISVQFSISEACLPFSKPNVIQLKAIGGEKPYTFVLTRNNTTLDINSELENGKYALKIKDNNSCTKDTSFVIDTKNCDLNYDFNPSLGDTWNKLEANNNGKISIMHILTQKTVLEKKIYTNETIEWDGKTQNGDISHGFHIFVIEYEDKTVIKGKITVTQ